MATESTAEYMVFPDLHGQYELAARVLDRYDLSEVTPVFAGDFVDIGPDTAKLLELIRQAHAEGAVALVGNHEWVLRNALAEDDDNPLVAEWRDTIWSGFEDDTLRSYGLTRTGNWRNDAERLAERMDSTGDLAFLRADLVSSCETDDFVVVHAGPVADQPWSAQRAELERTSKEGERLSNEPRQLFDHRLARPAAVPEHVDRRVFVTGHVHLTATALERRIGNRVCLASRLEANQPLYVWESGPDRVVEIGR